MVWNLCVGKVIYITKIIDVGIIFVYYYLVTRIQIRRVILRLVMSIFLMMLLIGAGMVVFDNYRRWLVLEARDSIGNNLILLGDPISQVIRRRVSLVEGLERFVLERDDVKISDEFEIFASGLHNEMEGVRNVGVAPNGVLTYIFPSKGNEAAYGYNLLADETPSVKSDVSRAMGVKEVVVSDPFELRQGGMGVAARKAVYKNNKLWGFVSTVIDVPSVMLGVSKDNVLAGILIGVRDKNGSVFWGNRDVFEKDPVLVKIDTVDGSWEMGAIPLSGWDGVISVTSDLLLGMLVFLGLLIFIVFVVLWINTEMVLGLGVSLSLRKEAMIPAISYLLVAVLWIVFSDRLVASWAKDPDTLTRISIVKGWLFVVVTSGLLYLWTIRSLKKYESLMLLLRRVQSVANLGYYVLDIKTGIWEGSDVLRRLFGIDDEYVTDVRGWLNIIHPDQRQEMESYFREEIIGKQRPFDKEYLIVNKNTGEELWVHGIGELEFDLSGSPIRMIGTIQDISEAKGRERQIRESEESFKNMFNLSLQGLMLQDQEGKVININTAGAKIFNIPRDQMIGKRVQDYEWTIVDESGDVIKNDDLPFIKALNTGRTVENEVVGVYLAKGTDSIRWVLISSAPLFKQGAHKPAQTITTILDITKNKVADNDLREASRQMDIERHRLQTVLWNMNDAVIMVGEDKKIELINRMAVVLTGYTEEEILGKKCEEVFRVISRVSDKEVACFTEVIFKTGRVECTEKPLVFQGKGRKYVKVSVVGTPIKNSQGKVIGAVMLMRNESKLEGTTKERSDYSDLFVHRVRSLLTGVKWFVELLKTGVGDLSIEQTKDYVDRIQKGNQELIEKADDLLMMDKIEKGDFAKENSELCLIKDLVNEAVEGQRSLLRDRQVNLDGVGNFPGESVVEADKSQVVEAFGSILNNAARYSSSGSKIDVRVEKNSETVKVAFKDQGVGIPDNQKSCVFEKFFRADNVMKQIPGSGLGLYVAKMVIENHGGRIWFESE